MGGGDIYIYAIEVLGAKCTISRTDLRSSQDPLPRTLVLASTKGFVPGLLGLVHHKAQRFGVCIFQLDVVIIFNLGAAEGVADGLVHDRGMIRCAHGREVGCPQPHARVSAKIGASN